MGHAGHHVSIFTGCLGALDERAGENFLLFTHACSGFPRKYLHFS